MSALRAGLVACAMLAAVAVAGAQRLTVAAAENAPASDARPDFSGVWFPNSRESGRWPNPRPYTQQMTARLEEWTKHTSPLDVDRDDEHLSCLGYAIPYMMTTITQYPFEIVVTPKRIYFFTETYGQVRRVDMDAPPPSPETLPSRTGMSRGHWEGATLVIETTKVLPEGEGSRFPSSSSQRIVERMTLEGTGDTRQLVNEFTVTDPSVYTQPVTVRMVHKKAAKDIEVGEYICGQDLWDQHLDGSTSQIPWR